MKTKSKMELKTKLKINSQKKLTIHLSAMGHHTVGGNPCRHL